MTTLLLAGISFWPEVLKPTAVVVGQPLLFPDSCRPGSPHPLIRVREAEELAVAAAEGEASEGAAEVGATWAETGS